MRICLQPFALASVDVEFGGVARSRLFGYKGTEALKLELKIDRTEQNLIIEA